MELHHQVVSLLHDHPAVDSVIFTGSRAAGTANDLSDWDFVIEARDFPGLAADLPTLLAPLFPILQQWDRLSDTECYMLMLEDATKVDLIFPAAGHRHEPPWVATADTLQSIDDHFWDWIIWLASKDHGGKTALLQDELLKLHAHILQPLGMGTLPTTVPVTIHAYVAARDVRAEEIGVVLSPVAQRAVLVRLGVAGYRV